MSKCSTGCATQDHASYAECLRAKSARVAYANTAGGWDYSTQKKWDRDLDAYASARKEGIQPDGTNRVQVEAAKKLSDKAGVAYKAPSGDSA